MKKLKIWKKPTTSKKMDSELANDLGNVRVAELEVNTSDVAHELVDELETPYVDAVVGEMGPPNTYTGYKECVSANPRSETTTLASLSALNLTPNEIAQIEQQISDIEVEDNSDDDYNGSDEDEYANDSDLFAENVVYGLDDVFIGEDEIRLIVDKEIDEENNRDIYVNDDELESDDDLGALNVDEEGIVSCATFNPEVDFKGKINLSLGLKFPSIYVFRKALRYHAIECGYNYYYLHNGRSRITVYCYNRCDCLKSKARIVNCVCGKDKRCYFKVHAKKLKDEETFQIRSYIPEHTCGHQHINNKVTALYLAEKYVEDWRENPNWDLRAFKKRVNRELGCEVKYSKCYMAKRIAKKMIVGDASEEYSRVWDYAEAIRRFNPGSTAIVKCIGIDTPPPLFQRMYICLPACKEGFVAGCRPILGVDGAHLKGEFPGVLMTAVGKDGNNNIFPIAWAVVETENVETWTWFLNLLVEDLMSVSPSSSCARVGCEDFTFMSDRQKV